MSDPFVNDQLAALASEERLKRLLARDDLLHLICANIVEGGTLPWLCKTWGVRFSDIMRWINADKEREKTYRQALNDRTEWYVETVLQELKMIATVDIRNAFDKDGKLLPIKNLPADLAAALGGIEVTEKGTTKIKLWDKLKALELAGRKHAMFVDTVKHTGSIKLEDMVGESMPDHLKPDGAKPNGTVK